MRKAGLIAGMFLCSVTPVAAQTPIDMPITDTLALSNLPFLNRDAFQRSLLAALPGISLAANVTDPPILDPFLWSLSGSFGPNGSRSIPGAIFACARYGLATRDYFAEHGFSTRETFALMGQVIPLPDDVEVWSEGAVARLYCSFVWDDERVVWILDEEPARVALQVIFDEVLSESYDATPSEITGYRLDATNGPNDSVTHVVDAAIILTQGHQSVSFRSYLMGGGF